MPFSEPTTTASSGSPAWFKTTHWSVVLEAGAKDEAQAANALSALCQAYWYALYTYVRRLGHSPEDAKDLTQGFFAQLIEKDYLKSVKPGKAKFRSFLLVALKGYLANEWHRAQRIKRGGGQELISLDEVDAENRYLAEPAMSPEQGFDRRWALLVLDRVMARLEQEALAAGKSSWFQEFKVFLSGDDAQTPYEEVAQKLGTSAGGVRVAVHRLRQHYRQLLRLEIAQTVQSPQEIDDEIRYLFSALA